MSEEKKNARWVPIVLGVLFAGPLIAAWILYFSGGWRPAGQAHHGTLVEPVRNLVEASGDLRDMQDRPVGDLLKGKWSLIQAMDADCRDSCSELSERIRQVRLALAHRRNRVQRLLLFSTPTLPSFAASDDGLIAVAITDKQPLWQMLDTASDDLQDTIYVADPLGNLFILYPGSVKQKALLEDLKRLLRLSRIG